MSGSPAGLGTATSWGLVIASLRGGACVLWCGRKRGLCAGGVGWVCGPCTHPLPGDPEPGRRYCAEEGLDFRAHGYSCVSLSKKGPSCPGLQDRLGEESAELGKRQSWRSAPPNSSDAFCPTEVSAFRLWNPSPFPWV